jgi:hypothetical protein
MPNPDTTQGEAEATARLAKEYGLRSITLVATPDQTWRAEPRFGRCYSGKIHAVTTPLPKQMWPVIVSIISGYWISGELLLVWPPSSNRVRPDSSHSTGDTSA